MKHREMTWIYLKRNIMYAILILAIVLTCTSCRKTRERSEPLKSNQTVEKSVEENEREEKSMLVFTIGFSSVVEDYTAMYPNEEIKVVQINDNELEKNFNKALYRYGEPDLVIDTCDRGIQYWVENGWIADMSVYFDSDIDFDAEAYYPGVDTVGEVGGILYGLPLGLQVDYLTVREEVWDDSAFSKLPEDYTALELFGAMEDELNYWMDQEPEEWKRVFSHGNPYSILEYLWASGAIQVMEDEVLLDREIFETVAQGYLKSSKNIADYTNQSGGFSALTDPREGKGRYIATNWNNGIAPQIGLIYYQSANQALLNQTIHVLWFPMQSADEEPATQYAAKVAIWGMIGKNSDQTEEAYMLLRRMMDVPMHTYTQVGYFGTMENIPFSINRQQALAMIDWAEEEYVNTFTIDSDTTIHKQPLSEELRNEMEHLLKNIVLVYATKRTAEQGVYNGINPYCYGNIIDMDLLYNNTLEALQVYLE